MIMREKKTLGNFIVKKYIMFSLVLIIGISIIYNIAILIFAFKTGGIITNKLIAKNIVNPNYKNINISYLKDVSGWVEILDSNNRVIYTKGKVLDKKKFYTEVELLEQSSLEEALKNKSINIIGNIITLSFLGNGKKNKYIASYAAFTGRDGKKYICVVKVPSERLRIQCTFVNPTGSLKRLGILFIALILLSVIAFFIACLYWYSRNIKSHIEIPNEILVSGLKDITLKNYSKRLNMNAEYEYMEIQDSFNYLATELEEASKQRENYEKERQQLLNNIVHDLKTPITSIRGYAKALMEGMVSDTKKQEEYLKTIYNKTEHLNNLTELLLTYTKLDNKEYKLKFEKVEFTEFVREIIADCFGEFEKKKINLKIEIQNDNIYISIDRLEMKRAIENLVLNAVKHNHEKTTIKVHLYKRKDRCIVLEVFDNGEPIPKNLEKSMFEPFVCGDESRTTKNGNGLGLSICKKIIEKHDGILEYKTLDDGWKCFSIFLKSNFTA